MRLRLAFLAAAALLLVSAPLVLAQTTRDFEATFRESFGRGNSPSGVGYVLGTRVTERFTFLGAEATGDPSCPTTTSGTSLFTWPDGSTITTEEHYLICFPGNARSAPSSPNSYGILEVTSGTFEIIGGTGQFVGVTGSGTIDVTIAGDVLILHYSGTITFP
ncbi:MAG TPA: hypothetical protein VKB00_02115 [Candidatus Limnocylindrales bacterium]|nr:hypothetical protein [Candidatus Limnocylindrales bacterium]